MLFVDDIVLIDKTHNEINTKQEEVRLDTKSSKRGGSFKYLESIIQVNKEIDSDVTHPIGARVVVRPTMLYGQVLANQELSHSEDENCRNEGVVMDVLHTLGEIRLEMKNIRDNLGVTMIEDKMKEARLRWFGHVKRRRTDALVQRCERLAVDSFRGDGGKSRRYIRKR
ncbi:hypothetical protein H5410_015848 [Solanum commersonii]|uniref:Reverse transcriptase domain-containing protein n=1 Tax=Solanum commersonii TaxID=4109 RepID=A0A9J5ZUZ1_SOLCO|nr:hypothetical protein H5410_015848 [Solanum commersonii]